MQNTVVITCIHFHIDMIFTNPVRCSQIRDDDTEMVTPVQFVNLQCVYVCTPIPYMLGIQRAHAVECQAVNLSQPDLQIEPRRSH